MIVEKKRYARLFLAVTLVLVVAFILVTVTASAASKRTVYLIKDKSISYYSNGLVKKIPGYAFKYDKKGRVTVIRDKEKDCIFKLKYTKKGKLKGVYLMRARDLKYKNGVKFTKVSKKGRILKADLYGDECGATITWKYDSKKRVKKAVNRDTDWGGDAYSVTNEYRYSWSSKGNLTEIAHHKVAEDPFGEEPAVEDDALTFATKRKSGRVTRIVINKGEAGEMSKSFKYKKVKVKKQFVKKVKAQQKDLLYIDYPEAEYYPNAKYALQSIMYGWFLYYWYY